MIRVHNTLPPVLQEAKKHDFKIFIEQDMDMNIIACRNPFPRPDEFDDLIHVVYRENGLYIEQIWPCTTDAGKYWLQNPSRAAGTAVLMSPYQYRSAFTFGLHRQTYPALVQRKTIPVWRDNDLDDEVEHINEGTANAIQIHRASKNNRSSLVGKWSAGCVVIQTDYDSFMGVLNKQYRYLGSKIFSLTVLEGLYL